MEKRVNPSVDSAFPSYLSILEQVAERLRNYVIFVMVKQGMGKFWNRGPNRQKGLWQILQDLGWDSGAPLRNKEKPYICVVTEA